MRDHRSHSEVNVIPSIGRIVHYQLAEHDIAPIQQQRRDHVKDVPWSNEHGSGLRSSAVHIGNEVSVGDVYPAMIVRVWSEDPNETTGAQLQVFLDGNDTYWATSKCQTTHEDGSPEFGHWSVPPRVG